MGWRLPCGDKSVPPDPTSNRTRPCKTHAQDIHWQLANAPGAEGGRLSRTVPSLHVFMGAVRTTHPRLTHPVIEGTRLARLDGKTVATSEKKGQTGIQHLLDTAIPLASHLLGCGPNPT